MTVKPGWRSRFLAALAETPNVYAALRAAGISRQHAYRTRSGSATFAQQWDDAQEDAIDKLELVAIERARASSDSLLIMLLKAKRPKIYHDYRRHELAGDGGGPIHVTLTWPEQLAAPYAAARLSEADS